MTDYFSSLFDNFKNRITNPLLGTLLIVWIIRNWIFVYSIFNFDKNWNVTSKAFYMQKYFKNYSLGYEIWMNIWISFSILGGTYILLALSRILTDYYYKVLEPLIIIKIDKKQIFTQAEAEILGRKIISLERRLEDSKKYESSLSNEVEHLDSELKSIKGSFESAKKDIEGLSNINKSHNDTIKEFSFHNDNSIESLANINFRNASSANDFFKKIYEKLDRTILEDLFNVTEHNDIQFESFEKLISLSTKRRLSEHKFLQKDISSGKYNLTILGYFFLMYIIENKKHGTIRKL